MSDDDKKQNDWSIRDKIAFELLPTILEYDKGKDLMLLYHYAFKDGAHYQKNNLDNLKDRIRFAYQIADVVREVRLEAFE